MATRNEILLSVFGEELLEQFKFTETHKFCSYEITPVDIIKHVPDEVIYQAGQKLRTKIFFQEDIYFTATPHKEGQVGNGLIYGIGVDPDKREFFEPYEE